MVEQLIVELKPVGRIAMQIRSAQHLNQVAQFLGDVLGGGYGLGDFGISCQANSCILG
jgi:hypothetical protein